MNDIRLVENRFENDFLHDAMMDAGVWGRAHSGHFAVEIALDYLGVNGESVSVYDFDVNAAFDEFIDCFRNKHSKTLDETGMRMAKFIRADLERMIQILDDYGV